MFVRIMLFLYTYGCMLSRKTFMVDEPKRRNRAEYHRRWRHKNLEMQRAKDRDKQRRLRARNPERYREYKREWRQRTRATSQGLLTQEHQEKLQRRAAEAQAKLGRKPETLSEWMATQSRFATEADLARAMGIKPAAVYRWRKGQRKPSNQQRHKLFEITGLACYADAAAWKPREKPARRKCEPASAPVIAQLVLRCGLPPRQLCTIRLSQIERDGIRLDARFIPFGSGWEHVDQDAVQGWIASAAPTDLLFFSLRPVDRARRASPDWIRSSLEASGISALDSRRIYMRHFAGDFARLRTDKLFVMHVRRDHGFAKPGAWAMLYRLRRQYEKLPRGTLARGQCKPEDAYDLLFHPKARAGRPITQRERDLQAQEMHEAGVSWAKITMKLDPEGYQKDRYTATDRIRTGVRSLRNSKKR
jgi:transcriptional regulator with XRE-family HTH domain